MKKKIYEYCPLKRVKGPDLAGLTEHFYCPHLYQSYIDMCNLSGLGIS